MKVSAMTSRRSSPLVLSALLLLVLVGFPVRAAELTADSVSVAAHEKYDTGDLDQAKALFGEVLT